MIENVLILDTETTGLFPDKGDKIIEIAAILFNVKHKSILQCFSTLLPCDENKAEKINHISPEITKCSYPFLRDRELIIDEEEMWRNPSDHQVHIYEEKITLNHILIDMCDASDACVAHNAQFDKGFINLLPCGEHLLNKKWICTKNNFTWPSKITRFRLEDICHGMGVPYLNAHRAMADCMLIAFCFMNIEDLASSINRC